MNIPLVMTIIGRDRPGLVEMVARIVAAHGGNWLESRMCHLGGEFAGILRVHVPAGNEPALVQALRELDHQGLTIVPHPDCGPETTLSKTIASLELVGQDRPGIVRHIAGVLANHKVNVEELSSECATAPMSGEMLFKARAILHVPDDCNMAELRHDLEKIAADLMVDISFSN